VFKRKSSSFGFRFSPAKHSLIQEKKKGFGEFIIFSLFYNLKTSESIQSNSIQYNLMQSIRFYPTHSTHSVRSFHLFIQLRHFSSHANSAPSLQDDDNDYKYRHNLTYSKTLSTPM
jgi:hypothetical protein